MNDHRRHLNEAQRGMVGAKLANLQKGGESGVHKTNSTIVLLPPVTQKEAAEMLNVGVGSIKQSKQVMRTENERALVGARMANLKKGANQHPPMGGSSPAVTITRAAELSGSPHKALAITFGTSTHPITKDALTARTWPMMMFLVEVINRMMKQNSLADVTDYMATIHDPSQLEPWEYLEPLNDDSEDERTEIINRLFGIIFPEVSRQPKKIMEISFRRFCALVYIIAPDKLGSTSQVEISNELGFTSAGFSKLCIELSVRLGIQPRSLRTICARKHPAEDGGDTRKRTSRAERDGKMLNDARIFFDKGKNWLSHHKVILKRKGYLNDDGKLTRAGIDWIGEQEEM